jgi:hypothetical protein
MSLVEYMAMHCISMAAHGRVSRCNLATSSEKTVWSVVERRSSGSIADGQSVIDTLRQLSIDKTSTQSNNFRVISHIKSNIQIIEKVLLIEIFKNTVA